MKRYIYLILVPLFLFQLACSKVESKKKEPVKIEVDTVNLKIDNRYAQQAAKIDSFFKNRNKRGLFNGAALFAEKGSVVYKKAFGFANFKKKDSLTLKSQFQLASVTKPLTAYAIMLLEHRGLITYEDSLRKFFPDFPYDNITVRNLLTHRSGLPNYMYLADDYWRDKRNITITNNDVIDLFIEYEPLQYYKPNRRYNYNNSNYCLLASIIEEVSNQPFEDFMKDEIFDTLKMNNTFVYRKGEQTIKDHQVRGYKTRRRSAYDSYLNGVVGDKGIYSTVEDLFKFDQALYLGKLVPAEKMKEAYKPAHPDLWDSDNYGFGWRINTKPDSTKVVHHTGWWKGFRTYFIRDLHEEKTIIVLSNVSKYGVLGTQELQALFDIEYH
ncbi:MAG: beta-lactamase family protein [Ignavibacteriae bacterium]|nr:beta-lactamase family protein [Ignavibacteriota bacterium]